MAYIKYKELPVSVRLASNKKANLYGEILEKDLYKIKEACKVNKNSIVCDIGSGSGNLAHAFTKHAKHVYAIEIDPDRHDYAKEQYGHNKNITFINDEFPSKKVPKCDLYIAHMCGFSTEDQENIIESIPTGSYLLGNGASILKEAIARGILKSGKVVVETNYMSKCNFYYFKK